MFSHELKKEISEKVQELLQTISHPELPEGEISFILHIDGKEYWSWANIRNNSDKSTPVPESLICNFTDRRK
uniref:Uncharacterized protein n=1 Tax=viral metagenome TaxID=1070528 RepID=A0A6M3KWJ2_9ZZZZ